MEVLPSAFRHHVEREDIQHVLRHTLIVGESVKTHFDSWFSALMAPGDVSNWLCWTARKARR